MRKYNGKYNELRLVGFRLRRVVGDGHLRQALYGGPRVQ